jgi:hypothetical protein
MLYSFHCSCRATKIVFDNQAVLARTYEAGGYAERLNYAVPCVPPLLSEDQTWADALIQQVMG